MVTTPMETWAAPSWNTFGKSPTRGEWDDRSLSQWLCWSPFFKAWGPWGPWGKRVSTPAGELFSHGENPPKFDIVGLLWDQAAKHGTFLARREFPKGCFNMARNEWSWYRYGPWPHEWFSKNWGCGFTSALKDDWCSSMFQIMGPCATLNPV